MLDSTSWMRSVGRVNLAGHFWSIAPSLLHGLSARPDPHAQPWSTVLEDSRAGPITLTGRLRALPGSDACLIVVHGLGGSPDTFYCARAAAAAEHAGLSCLRLSLRGADRSGEDFYHAGLVADLQAAVQSAALAAYLRIYVLGYSLGGHVSLRYALAPGDERVRAFAAICAPLDLELSAQAIDRTGALVYRRHVLTGLKDIYSCVARRKPVPTPLARVLAARTIREWDGLTVVPRFGFGSVASYYESMSVGPCLAQLERPALLVQSTADPMVPPWTYEQHLVQLLPRLDVRRLHAGGHVGFPAEVALDGDSQAGLEDQVVRWLIQK
jgi:predicted alpha/beta-fold hydrolase